MARIPLLAALLLVVGVSSCQSVEFYEKAAFPDPVMVFDVDRAEAHFHQKCFYSMEGSAGGIGSSAGGGCGCY